MVPLRTHHLSFGSRFVTKHGNHAKGGDFPEDGSTFHPRMCFFHGVGNLATASFPSTEFSWKARSKDHHIPDPANLRVFAISTRRNLPVGRVTAVIVRSDSGQAPHPAAVATVPPAFALTGGGGQVHFHGILATGVFYNPTCGTEIPATLWFVAAASIALPLDKVLVPCPSCLVFIK